MTADDPAWRQLLTRGKDAIKRRRGRGIPVAVPDEPYLVVPVLGQSNAHGAGLGLDTVGLDKPHPWVHQWALSGRSKNTVVAGGDPLFHEVPSPGVGFAPTFGRYLADATGRPVLLVPAARGDTSFTAKNGYTWDPSDTRTRVNLYRRAVAAIDAALAVVPGSRVAVVLWHQGESDVPLTPGPVYAAKLDELVGALRGRYGADLPIVIGQMVPEEIESGHPDYPVIDAVHADTPRRRRGTVFVPGPRDCYNNHSEKIHYNAAGQRLLGRAMWLAYRDLA